MNVRDLAVQVEKIAEALERTLQGSEDNYSYTVVFEARREIQRMLSE